MPDSVTKEAIQLMFTGPINIAANRRARAKREKREDVAALWGDAMTKLQTALNACATAAAFDR